MLTKIDRFTACLSKEASRLDDFVSPASDIAAVIASECSGKWQAVLSVTGEMHKMNDYPSKAVLTEAVRQVLIGRATARDGKRRQ